MTGAHSQIEYTPAQVRLTEDHAVYSLTATGIDRCLLFAAPTLCRLDNTPSLSATQPRLESLAQTFLFFLELFAFTPNWFPWFAPGQHFCGL